MANAFPPAAPPVLIIGGMHRSGTSLVASLCQSSGLAIGQQLVEPHASNRFGHFEDLDFYRFHEAVLTDNGRIPAGYDPPDAPLTVSERRRAEAQAILRERRGHGRPWGWKDPRTTLFLDFWLEIVPEARFFFVFRHPLLVADSLHRRGDAYFLNDDERALRLWHRYNAAIRDFTRDHGDRVLVRSIDQVINAPHTVFSDIRTHLGVPLAEPLRLFHPEMLSADEYPTPRGIPANGVVAACHELHADLQELSRDPSGAPVVAGPAGHDRRTRVAVVIPVPRLPLQADEAISFQQLRHHLFAHDSVILAPESLDVTCLGMRVQRFPDACFTGVASYNRLLLTQGFYEAFREYEYILIYQLDCLVFSSDLEGWCNRRWDYVGAPWFLGFRAGPEGGLWRVGNGGLSLRRIDAFRTLLQHENVKRFLENYQGQEDVFWSFVAPTFDPRFRIPEPAEALAFSIESSPRKCFELNGNALPFGCHYWNRVDRSFWTHFLAPGVTSGCGVLDDSRHPDQLWARGIATRLLRHVAQEQDEVRLLSLLTDDIPSAILDAPPTEARVEQAFDRLLSQTAPVEWLAFWVAKPHLTLRQLYQDLIRGEQFQQRRARMVDG